VQTFKWFRRKMRNKARLTILKSANFIHLKRNCDCRGSLCVCVPKVSYSWIIFQKLLFFYLLRCIAIDLPLLKPLSTCLSNFYCLVVCLSLICRFSINSSIIVSYMSVCLIITLTFCFREDEKLHRCLPKYKIILEKLI
jgi:hypothetical protein